MPEVMEIRKYCDFVRDNVLNKKLLEINIIGGRYKKHSPFENYNDLKNKLPIKLSSINSKGKFIYISLEDKFYILNTLGLTGGWAFKPFNANKYYVPKLLEYISEEKVNSYLLKSLDHGNVEFVFENGKLYFFDQLSFGTMKVIDNKILLNKKLNTLGPDIMDINTTLDLFLERIKKRTNQSKKIGNVIMNQKVISGVGNYIRADALWLSKINPFRNVKTLNDDELKKLYHSLKIITWGNYNKKEAIKLNIINKDDKTPYDYKRDFFVYREEKDIYNNKVKKEELYEGSQKRFIYWCPDYQN